MATKKQYQDLIAFINENWEMQPYEGKKAIERMDHSHYPLEMANRELYDKLYDMIDEFAEDNNLEDARWIEEIDIERVFFDCDAIFGDRDNIL